MLGATWAAPALAVVEGGHAWTQWLSAILALLTVIAIIVLLGRAARSWYPGFKPSADMRITSTLPLGPRERLIIVETDGQRLLIGVTAQQIQLLQALSPQPGVEREQSE